MRVGHRRLSEIGFVARSSENFEGKSEIPDFERGRQDQNIKFYLILGVQWAKLHCITLRLFLIFSFFVE